MTPLEQQQERARQQRADLLRDVEECQARIEGHAKAIDKHKTERAFELEMLDGLQRLVKALDDPWIVRRRNIDGQGTLLGES